MKRLVLLVPLFALAACSITLEIESDTSWSGAVGGTSSTTIDGSRNRSIDIPSGTCWSFQKQTETGRLRVYATSTSIVGATNREGEAVTTARYGVVSGCASGS